MQLTRVPWGSGDLTNGVEALSAQRGDLSGVLFMKLVVQFVDLRSGLG
jgi:hypothetical protein